MDVDSTEEGEVGTGTLVSTSGWPCTHTPSQLKDKSGESEPFDDAGVSLGGARLSEIGFNFAFVFELWDR